MDGDFPLLSTLTLLGAAHGLFLTLALINTKSGDVKAHRILALFTILFAVDLGEEYLYQSGFFKTTPHLLQVLAPIDLLYGPVLFFYVSQLTSPTGGGGVSRFLWHLLPVIVGVILLLPFYVYLDGSVKHQFIESLRAGSELETQDSLLVQLGTVCFALLTIVQIGIYLLLSSHRAFAHYNNIKQHFSDLEKINLIWLRNLLIGLIIIYILFLGDLFVPNLFDINLLGDSTTILAVILIYAMGYLGLKQPRIFTQTVHEDSIPEVTTPISVERYKKSGLDSDSSSVFLDELTSHMKESKPYLQGDLTLTELAGQLGISPNYLSQIINEQLNQNFHDFINRYRVEEAQRLLQASDTNRTNILHIAFESGFNSKSTFYSAFKKVTNMTPKQFSKVQ